MIGSTSEDIHGVPKNRGPVEEDRKTEAELRGQMKDIASAKASMGELITIKGMQAELTVFRSMLDDLCEQNTKLMNLYTMVRQEFDQYKKQRAVELQSWLANGQHTSQED